MEQDGAGDSVGGYVAYQYVRDRHTKCYHNTPERYYVLSITVCRKQ